MGLKRNALGYTLLLCCLLSVVLFRLSEGKRDSGNRAGRSGKQARGNRCKSKTTFTLKASDLKASPTILKCYKGPVVSASVVGIKGKCRGSSGFTRWNADRCTWNQTCQLTFKDQGMDSLAPGVTDNTCLGQVPDKLEYSYTCLKKKVVVTDTLGTFKKTKKRVGVVRSHKLFPWSYRNGVELGNVTFLRPRKPPGLTHLWISVHLYAIKNSDLMFLSWEGRSPRGGAHTVQAIRQLLPNDTLVSLPEVSAVVLTFYADYRHHHSDIGGEEKGFILCYQWLKPNTRPKKGSACSKVMVPAKCKSKRGRGGRRKAGKSGSRNKNNPRSRNNQRSRNDPRSPGSPRSSDKQRSRNNPRSPGSPRSSDKQRSRNNPRSPGSPRSSDKQRSRNNPRSTGSQRSRNNPRSTGNKRSRNSPRSPPNPRSPGNPRSRSSRGKRE
ncbi:uncharacterized protein LOC143276014 [Babylonia areolata]|uniref:uncharacterized protein LOC143276014 n=1 Tax=Babylonia areolata TaxID=304850 RepID=UPI003FD40FD3